jgi:1,4-dihydroxy-2-naphthoate polyprenyltransferase
VTTTWQQWVAGARPRTLPAAVVPVVVGTAVGYLSSGRLFVTTVTADGHQLVAGALVDHSLDVLNGILALVVALGVQIGTNFVNDYADGVRGTDEVRVGPVRLVAGKLATVGQVKVAALIAFGVAGVAGLVLAARVTWWLVPLGLLCAVAGWAYTGGPHPYGYLGLGELFVFIFFGLVATAGSAYVQHAPFATIYQHLTYRYSFPWPFALWAGVPVGLLAAALLQANNVRDIETDTEAGKRTLAVRLGRQNAGLLYVVTLMATALSIGVLQHYRGWSLIALAALPLAFHPVQLALGDATGKRLLPMLATTARLQLATGVLLTVGLLLLRP